MATTIKDIARLAGVSIATVSHVINHTRYVSPELVERVEKIINETDYKWKMEKKSRELLSGKQSVIAIVMPAATVALYMKLTEWLSAGFLREGILTAAYYSADDYETECQILKRLVVDKKTAGIILCPSRPRQENYEEFFGYQIPFVFLERRVEGCEKDCVAADNKTILYKAVTHLIKSGHEKIALLVGNREKSTVVDRIDGYKKALSEKGLVYREDNILSILTADSACLEEAVGRFCIENRATALISCGNRMTFMALKAMQRMGLECPRDLSVIGFEDGEWCDLFNPPLTSICHNVELMASQTITKMLDRMGRITNQQMRKEILVPMELVIRKSTQMIGRGPFGEKAHSPAELVLSEEEKKLLRVGDYKVGIAFHYSGTAWKTLHENGIRQTLEKYGITVVTVTDAHFDPYLQVTQLEGIGMQNPDAVIAIPVDDHVTADTFKKLSRKTKLLFLSNVPEGFGADDYVSCISVNEREHGHSVGTQLGEYFKQQAEVKVGFINHGASFYGTHLRDMVAMQVVCESYPNIEVAAVNYFQNIEDTYKICKKMLKEHPDLNGLYISWDQPALHAIRALKEAGREDMAIFTFDLDEEIGGYLARGTLVKGMSTQRPYEQGVAIALATAKALLGRNSYKYIGVPPYLVRRDNLLRAWNDIFHEPAPKTLEELYKRNK